MCPATNQYDPWPALPYDAFNSTRYLLHMFTQAIGKLKLITPFEPHWGNVVLWLTARGLTTGTIPYGPGVFSVDIDFINHEVTCASSWGKTAKFPLSSQSIAQLTSLLYTKLKSMDVAVTINLMPQEVKNPIAFDKDTQRREYNAGLANAWWRILTSSYRVLLRYHSHFKGISPGIGLMWGTFDLRDARYLNQKVAATAGQDFITRNAYDAPQVEAGWWSGDERYPRPAYFSFLYPTPKDIERIKIKPDKARWNDELKIFILDYDDVRASKNPDEDLLAFFESAYKSEAEKAGWDNALITSGEPI